MDHPMIRHGRRRREASMWPVILGCLVGFILGVLIFGIALGGGR